MKRRLFVVGFCVFVFLLPLKFGNPIVLESITAIPAGGWDWLMSMWPNQLGMAGMLLIVTWSMWVPGGWARVSPRAWWIPCAFLATQLAAMPASVSPQVSLDTVVMFAASLGMYSIALRRTEPAEERWPYTVLLGATAIVCLVTLQQYFGGLQETREFFRQHYQGRNVDPDYLIKLAGDRPWGTLGYPNSLGGYFVLLLPVLVARIWQLRDHWERAAVWVVLVAFVGLMLFCLVLSGSKGAFLTLVAVVVFATLFVQMPRRMKLVLLLLLALCGAGLAVRYGPRIVAYGLSTSSARIDYWRAGLRIFTDHPGLGTGPGTFGTVYPQYKLYTPEDPRLAHNNFLEALTDTGVFGFVTYTALWLVPFGIVARRLRTTRDPMTIGLTLSLAAWIVHGLVDFDQYIPSLSLLAFFFLGQLEQRMATPAPAVDPPLSLRLGVSILALLLCCLPVFRLIGQKFFQDARVLTEKNPYAATQAIETAIHFSPLDPAYNSQASMIEWKRGNFEKALLGLERAHLLDPRRSTYAWETAMLYRAEQGLSIDYFRAAEQAIALAPKNPRYREVLAQDYSALGLSDQASEHLKALHEINEHLHPQPSIRP